MDHIILVLMVAVVGSLLLPATRLARVVKRGQSRTTYAHYRVSSIQLKSKTNKSHRVQREAAAGRETIGEIKEQTDHNPSAGVGDFEFRPLTEGASSPNLIQNIYTWRLNRRSAHKRHVQNLIWLLGRTHVRFAPNSGHLNLEKERPPAAVSQNSIRYFS